MKVVISPAKSLDYTTDLPLTTFTNPVFLKQSKEINTVLKDLTPNELKDLMSISDKLAELNWQRNQERKYKLTELNPKVRQAMYAFNGDVYTGLDAYSLSSEKVDYLQEHRRLSSALHGLLKLLDAMESYRVEIGTKLPIDEKKD